MLYSRSRTRHRFARRLSWLFIATLTSVALIAPSSVLGHTPNVTLTCQGGLHVNLTSYNSSNPNTVAISIDGTPVAGSPFTFGSSFNQTYAVAPPTVSHTATVAVTAWDDPTGSKGWTKTFNRSIEACQQPTQAPTEAPTNPPTEAPTQAPTEAPTQAPTEAPTQAPTEAPTQAPTEAPTQAPTAPPTGQFTVPSFSTECGGSITVTNFASANVDDVLITPGDVVINADGTYPLEPGDYSAVGRVGGEVVTDAVPFTIEACPTAAPTESPTEASILIAKLDSRGTADPEDDVLLDGASFEVYLDDGDEAFDDGDELVFGAAATSEGMLDTDLLESGWYWIVEAVVPEGYTGSDPILVELNTDPSITCIWDSHGLIECEDNEGNVDDLSWTIVLVDNTPVSAPTEAPPTGGVGGATGTPGGAGVTLPPTDTLTGGPEGLAGDGWRLILLAMAGLMAAALLVTPSTVAVRRDDERD